MIFLKEVVRDVLECFPEASENLIFITPGKRPALFLKKYFAEFSQKPCISPEFITISELCSRISNFREIEGLPLLFEFYETYKSTCQTEPDSFETFIGWGQTLLKDFNDIDQHLIQPEKIFPYIHALKQAEHWSGADELTEMQKKHLDFWNTLGDYYFAFNDKLTRLKGGYSGYVTKKAVEKLPEYLQNNTKIHVFVGFNALSKAEQKIIHSLLMDSPSEIYWDIDSFFINSEEHDAGFFIRKYIKNWKYYEHNQPKWFSSHYKEEKNISILGVPKSVNQVHVLAELLNNFSAEKLEKSALVVADENMLIPALQVMSPNHSVNITMGYPLQQTPLNDLFVAYFRLHLSKNYYYKDVLNLISQPFLQNLFSPEGVAKITRYIKNHNLNYLSVEKIAETACSEDATLVNLLFPKKNENFVATLIKNALELIYAIKNQLLSTENKESVLYLEYVYRFYELFNQLQQLQNRYGYIDSVKTLYHFYLDVLQKSTLNFVGEPLEGLQVMGILESRSLDFENIIITSVNEGIFPLSKSGNSLIPYDAKYFLELPTFKERDAIYSYTFYRLLQRAKNVYLLYDTETNSLKSKEKSRFILQLLTQKIPSHQVTHQIKAPEVYPAMIPEMRIPKTQAVFERLREMAHEGLSPSAITNYILNPIVFYQQNVLKIYEERDVEETVEARTFGDIVHLTLQELYTPLLNKPLAEHHFEQMHVRVQSLIEKYFLKEYKNDYSTGKNLLIFNVIQNYIHRFIELERQEVRDGKEIVVLKLEQKMSVPFEEENLPFPVCLKGIIDRVDMRDGVLHIIDYKTGSVEASNVGIFDWEKLITDFKFSKAFQLLSYAYMYKKQFGEPNEMVVGNFSFKKLNQGLIRFHTKNSTGREKSYTVTDSTLENYKKYTEKLLLEIFDMNIPFLEKQK